MKKNGDEKEKESSELTKLLQQVVDGQEKFFIAQAETNRKLEKLDSIDTRLENLEGVQERTIEAINLTNESLEKTNVAVNLTNERLEKLEHRIEEFHFEVKAEVYSLRKTYQESFDGLLKRLDKNFIKLIEAMEERTNTKLEEFEKRLAKVEAKGR